MFSGIEKVLKNQVIDYLVLYGFAGSIILANEC